MSELIKKYHTSPGSGQIYTCPACNKGPTEEGHDGCLGTLKGKRKIMNACCGHGIDSSAYIQYWDGEIIAGEEALTEQKRLLNENKEVRDG